MRVYKLCFHRLNPVAAALLLLLSVAVAQAEPAALSTTKSTSKPAPPNGQVPVQPGLVAALVEGEPVFLDKLNSPDIAKTRRQLFSLERGMLQQVVLERLRKEKPKEFRGNKIRLTEAEITLVYEQAGLRSKGTLDSFRERIRAYLTRTKIRKMDDALFAKAVRKGYVTSYLTPPPAYRYRLNMVERAASLGPKNAPVRVVEFSDFQ
jgi:hypothetical protein